MMGKLHSKHADCIFVNADLNKALEDSIWKKKTGFNLANYNMEETLSELSICLEEKSESSSSPLRVDLPPPKLDTETSKVLRLDHIGIRRAGRHGLKDKTKLNIEELQELECGVHLEGSDTAKHEWSFTLYDFDGHGRITKEDLASLLKALYDAVGSSIKLPPNGAKTLKLRLSVGQDGGSPSLQQMTQDQGEYPGCSGGNNNSNNCHNGKNNFNNVTSSKKNNIVSGTTFASRVSERSRNTARAPKNKVREFSKLNNLTRAAASEQKLQKQQVKRTNEHCGQQARLASLCSAAQLAPPPSVCSAAQDSGLFLPATLTAEVNSSSRPAPGESEQPGLPQPKEGAEPTADDQAQATTAHAFSDHQRLADLVQENMERNKVRQQLRRLGDHRADGYHRSQHHNHHHHHSRHHKRRHQRATAAATTSSPQRPVSSTQPTVTIAGNDREETSVQGRLPPPPTSQWWASGKPTSKALYEEEEADQGEDGESQRCTRTCGLIGHCRDRGKSSETKEKKLFVSLREDVKEESKEEVGLSRLQEERAEESQDRRNYYLDLAGVENTSSRFQNNHLNPHNRPGYSRRCHKGHHRSRSQDLATAHVTSGADIKFSNVISGKSLDNCGSVLCSGTRDFPRARDINDCLCKPNSSSKCDNLLFSAVAFGLSLASETPQLREKCDNKTGDKTEHITVGNSVVRMLATASRTESLEHQRHGRSKSFDPQDATGGSSELGKRARRNHKQSKQSGDLQLPTCNIGNRTGLAASNTEDHLPSSTAKLNPLNFTVNSSSSTTTTTTTTDNNNVSSNNLRSRRFRPLSLPGHVPACVSPHHHRRHRHRDKDHSQAMQQVAQWIEREQHAWDQDMGAAAGDHILVQRHEHHHIHEHHHHHHYHHYHET